MASLGEIMAGGREPVARGVSTKNVGLRGVTVADTAISDVDGQAGRLLYRGYSIEVLAERSCYEEVAHLLVMGDMPTRLELSSLRDALSAGRSLSPEAVGLLRAFAPRTKPVEVLQAVSAALAETDPAPGEAGRDAERRRALDLTGKMASLTAAWHRIRQGLDPVPSSFDLGHAADFLRMLNGSDPDPALARDLDVALILHADHSMNASTFVARAVASTRAHLYASISAALGALSGELHGGANAQVMEMLQEIGDLHAVEEYVRSRLEAGERIMGMGHAVYDTDDPRAVILREMSRRTGERLGDTRWYELTRRVQEATQRSFRERKGGDIYPNVDMYSASLYHVMGIPRDLFTPVFAAARVAGWSAHVIEERFAEAAEKPQLYRPLSDYVGQYCGPAACEYVPLEKRV